MAFLWLVGFYNGSRIKSFKASVYDTSVVKILEQFLNSWTISVCRVLVSTSVHAINLLDLQADKTSMIYIRLIISLWWVLFLVCFLLAIRSSTGSLPYYSCITVMWPILDIEFHVIALRETVPDNPFHTSN